MLISAAWDQFSDFADNDGPTTTTGERYNSNFAEPGDAMMLDDTKTTTYIYNLDQELAEADASEDGLVFLPALTAKMISVPKSVLSPSNSSGKELVLYAEPSSLTVSREQDCVRKAIIESRTRARAERKYCNSDHASSSSLLSGKELNTTGTCCSDDLMDLD